MRCMVSPEHQKPGGLVNSSTKTGLVRRSGVATISFPRSYRLNWPLYTTYFGPHLECSKLRWVYMLGLVMVRMPKLPYVRPSTPSLCEQSGARYLRLDSPRCPKGFWDEHMHPSVSEKKKQGKLHLILRFVKSHKWLESSRWTNTAHLYNQMGKTPTPCIHWTNSEYCEEFFDQIGEES